jgi:signal transduction histidine kinase
MMRLHRPAGITAAVAVVVVGVAVLALFAIPASDVPLTYRGTSHAAQVLGIGAGVALIVAALLAVRAMIALLLLALAAVWFGQDLAAIGDSAALLRAVATGAAPFAAVLALHLALALPEGRLSRRGRVAAGAAYLAAAVIAVGTVALRDPFLDLYCWRQCGENPLLVHASPDLARTFVVAGLLSSIAIGALAVGVIVWRILAASGVARALLAPALIPAGLVAASEGARGAALLVRPFENPHQTEFVAVYLLRAGSLMLLAGGVAWILLRRRRTRARLTRLAADLGAAPPPGRLRESLAAALGDPKVDVLYWVAAARHFVDADGALQAQPARTATRITRGGRLLAIVVYDGAVLAGEDLERLLGPAARLAIENEALRAEVLAQLHELRRSRARIVATADESRRRLERDLHDGAQQRLLAVILDLRLARAGVHGELAERLGHVNEEVDRAFAELRELAHGIYPAVLTEAGLEAALPTLADVAPLAVSLHDVADERFSAAVEAGAYVTVDEAIRDAAARRATAIDVSAAAHDGRLVITADDDGAPRNTSLVHVADRVGALGGVLDLAPTALRAEIPCG